MVSLPATLMSLALLGAGETVLLNFSADWCAPCRAMKPTLEALRAKGYPVRKVDVEREPALAQRLGVTSLPTFVMLADGREVGRLVGRASLDQLEQMCRRAPGTATSESSNPSAVAAGVPRGPGGAGPASPARAQVVPAAATSPANGSGDWHDREAETADDLETVPPWGDAQHNRDDQLIAATVRLRIQDPHGHSRGTGTLIDARGGEALILTCGHIFRDSQGKGRIEVDLFGPHASQRIPGRLVAFDLKTDVGLVAIRVPGTVASARLAPPDHELQVGQSVVSVGCDRGADPTVRHSRVNSLNKFLGPANIQVAGQPVEGRSGGGLFTTEGYLVGVCNAADPQDGEGLFAAAECIHAILDEVGLAYVYDPSQPAPLPSDTPSQPAKPEDETRLATAAPSPSTEPVRRGALEEIQWPSGAGPVRPVAATRDDLAAFDRDELPTLDRDERTALAEIRRRLDDGYEVVCIIRPRDNSRAKSEVLVLDKVSSDFLQHLEAAAHAAEKPRFTSSRE